MNELKEVDEDAYNWLQSHSTAIWARHMFKIDGQTDTVLNNMCESFNNIIEIWEQAYNPHGMPSKQLNDTIFF